MDIDLFAVQGKVEPMDEDVANREELDTVLENLTVLMKSAGESKKKISLARDIVAGRDDRSESEKAQLVREVIKMANHYLNLVQIGDLDTTQALEGMSNKIEERLQELGLEQLMFALKQSTEKVLGDIHREQPARLFWLFTGRILLIFAVPIPIF